MIALDIYSDPICPWCFIGKAALDRALESRPNHPFAITWHPFMLNPDMPPDGLARDEYMALKFGGEDAVLAAYAPVVQAAERAGLVLNLPAISRTPSTLDAHRLLHWAGLDGVQTRIADALFRAYFQQGHDIGDRAVLVDLAGRVGMDSEMVTRLLASDADVDLIRQSDRDARARGIRGVPCFIVAGTHAVTGAQPTGLWQSVIDELAG